MFGGMIWLMFGGVMGFMLGNGTTLEIIKRAIGYP
jgi:hypothetical protein